MNDGRVRGASVVSSGLGGAVSLPEGVERRTPQRTGGLVRALCFFSRCLLSSSWLVLSVVAGCGGGGGGGGGEFVGAALVNIDAVPRRTDPGKRVRVTARINEVHPDGIFLKIRYPDGFSYAQGTARFEYRDSVRIVNPQYNLLAAQEASVYLVFNLPRSLFGEDNEGTVVFELNSESEVQDGKIEVDADVNDPTIADDKEFKVNNPEFDAQDDVRIDVID